MLHHYIVMSEMKNAPWITFVHGIGVGSDIWENQKKLSENFNLLFIDLPGHGKSSEGLKDMTSANFLTLSIKIKDVLDFNQIEKSIFISLSLGTLVTKAFAVSYPYMVEKLILCGAIEGFSILVKLFLKVFPYVKNMLNCNFMYPTVSYIVLPGEKYKHIRNLFVSHFKSISIDEYTAWYNMHYDAYNWLNISSEQLNLKKVYIMGSNDFLFLSHLKKKSLNKNKDRLVIMENTGHVCNIENPERFNKLILSVLY